MLVNHVVQRCPEPNATQVDPDGSIYLELENDDECCFSPPLSLQDMDLRVRQKPIGDDTPWSQVPDTPGTTTLRNNVLSWTRTSSSSCRNLNPGHDVLVSAGRLERGAHPVQTWSISHSSRTCWQFQTKKSEALTFIFNMSGGPSKRSTITFGESPFEELKANIIRRFQLQGGLGLKIVFF